MNIGTQQESVKTQKDALLASALAELSDHPLSPENLAKARAQVRAFHDTQFDSWTLSFSEVEETKDFKIPGTDWVFHYRLDAKIDGDYGTQVLDWKTIAASQAKPEYRSGLRSFLEHDRQVNYYARAECVPTLDFFHLVKSGKRLKKNQTPDQLESEVYLDMISDPAGHFFHLIIAPISVDEVDAELVHTVERLSALRAMGNKAYALKNRRACKGCPFQEVCTHVLDLDDDRYFQDKQPAVEGGKYISVSQQNTWHECERAWYHTYVDWREPRQHQRSYFSYGAAVHDALEVWAKGIAAAKEADK